VFDSIDEDGSGYIDKKEIGRAFLRAGVSLSELDESVKQTLDSQDEDGSGTLSFDEFLEWMK